MELEQLDYNQIIGIFKETNRPPGGFKTISKFVNNTNISSKSKVLEIGTSTGFTAIELTKLVGCNVTAIDINRESLKEAENRSTLYGVSNKITFEIGDATSLQYPDESFDFVFCGNVTSLVPNRHKALNEYIRVLKFGGVLIAVPIYYLQTPSDRLIQEIRLALRVDVQIETEDYWNTFYSKPNLEEYYKLNYKFDFISKKKIDYFLEDIFSRNNSNLSKFSKEELFSLKKKYKDYIFLFRDNLSIMGYSLKFIRKEKFKVDTELFTSTEVKL